MSVRLGKSASTDALEWGIHYRNPIDGPIKLDSGTPAKFGQWQTLEFYAKVGDEQTGRIWLAIDGETLVDQTVRTTENEVVWSKVQPLKVYGNIVDIVTDPEKGAKPTLKVWFDDLEIWTEPPSGTLP